MNTCLFRTQACSLSRPCSKCRGATSYEAHIIIRPTSRVGLRKSSSKAGRTRYLPKRGGYWHRQAA